jgi:hypothetical protein
VCPDCEPYTKLLTLARTTRLAKQALDQSFAGLSRLAEALGKGEVAWTDPVIQQGTVYWRTFRSYCFDDRWSFGFGVAVEGERDGKPTHQEEGVRIMRYELRHRRLNLRFQRLAQQLNARVKLAVEAA